MIPAERLSIDAFRLRFPPKAQFRARTVHTSTGESPNPASILNDVPPHATSCMIYGYKDLVEHRPNPPTYPIPTDFRGHRKLESLQAVFKKIPDAEEECVFSHMWVAPKDVERVLGNDFIERMHDVRRDVSSMKFYLTYDRSPEVAKPDGRWKNIQIWCRIDAVRRVTLSPGRYKRNRKFYPPWHTVLGEGNQIGKN
jgi:hypothetical protein